MTETSSNPVFGTSLAKGPPSGDGTANPYAGGCRVEFSGNTGAYFNIWIVNTILSVVTIGIWSAWAKVRRLRYFYGNTHVAGGNFDYLATGGRILRVRIIVVVFVLAYTLIVNLFPVFGTLLVFPYLVLIPWVINKSVSFNARMTIWRNVRFGFKSSYKKAFLTFVLFPLLLFVVIFGLVMGGSFLADSIEKGHDHKGAVVAFVACLIASLVMLQICLLLIIRSYRKYYTNNHFLGNARFDTQPPLKGFYKAFFSSQLLFVVLGLIFTVGFLFLVYVVVTLSGENISFSPPSSFGGGTPDDTYVPSRSFSFWHATIVVLLLSGLVAYSLSIICFHTMVRAHVINYMILEGGHRFRSTLSGVRYCWILATNSLAVVFTLGLMKPWAKIRAWRYQCDNLFVWPADSLEEFVSTSQSDGSAFGAEYLDFEGISVGI